MTDPGTETRGDIPGKSVLETEWQFELDDLQFAEHWISAWPREAEPSVLPDDILSLTDAYYDTRDWRVFRAGYALRLRHQATSKSQPDAPGVEAALKSRSVPKNGLARRMEITEIPDGASAVDFGDAFPPAALSPEWSPSGAVGSRLRRLRGKEPLFPLTILETRRQQYRVDYRDGVRGSLVLDRTVIRSPDGSERARMQRVELEVPESSVARFETFLAELRKGLPLRPAPGSKLEAALSALGREPADLPELGPTRLHATMPAGEAARAILRRQLHAMLRHEPGTRLGEDQEELHAMRVATRRMRAALRLFRDHLPATLVQRVERELRRLGSCLGAVRDLDVQIDRLDEWKRELVSASAEAFSPVIELMSAQREDRRRDLLRVLDSPRYEATVAFLVDFLKRPAPRARRPSRSSEENAGRPRASARPDASLSLVAADLIGTLHKKARKLTRRVIEHPRGSGGPPLDDLHRLRIRCKRFRYALEFLEEVIGPDAGPMIKATIAVQDTLGLVQDGRLGITRMREIAGSRELRVQPETAMALGEVARRYGEQMEAAIRQAPKVLRRLRGKRWKRVREGLKPA